MKKLEPYSWKERPALIETLLPVQKLSVESYKEQMAGQGKTLTALGSFWKGRKPLVLNKACVLGALLPSTENSLRDLEIFEMLMGMDERSLHKRGASVSVETICERVPNLVVREYFDVQPTNSVLPERTPFFIKDFPLESSTSSKPKFPKLKWKEEVSSEEYFRIHREAMGSASFTEKVRMADRAEEVGEGLYDDIWEDVNSHLGTHAESIPELVEEMGIARFGHRPKVADVFCGSGQIPFEAARLGCDVYASDLNPIACMLTWGAFHIVGAGEEERKKIEESQKALVEKVQKEIDALDIESDGKGWKAKAFLYCVEVVCPESGWKVPLIPSLIISKGYRVIAVLVPEPQTKTYKIEIRYVTSDSEVESASVGTVRDGDMVHSPDGITEYRVKISTIRGDHSENGENKNKLRLWEKEDFVPRADDIYQERLYCIQWMKKKPNSKSDEYEFRSVTKEDLDREEKVIRYVKEHLLEWQEKGYVPDMKIEPGYNTDQPIRERGWTYWHHLFNARQLLYLGKINSNIVLYEIFQFSKISNYLAKLCTWETTPARRDKNGKQVGGASNNVKQVFTNQALNTLFNYGCRSIYDLDWDIVARYYKLDKKLNLKIRNHQGEKIDSLNDIYITDPPYGDAVKYEEITEFFIAWLRKNPPEEFKDWTWDSRRALAIKGSGEEFRQGMIASYTAMKEHMPDNGIQILMFTHKSGSIWGDLANIVWASGLQVTSAWYVVTESDSALRQGANVTGTILLVLRKRKEKLSGFRDDLGWEIESAVRSQVEKLVGLDTQVRKDSSEGLFKDADIQMAGYAASLKVLTAYSTIDGKDMEVEARAPKREGVKTFVDNLIDFAVQTAVQYLIPISFEESDWRKFTAEEKYYLKMLEMEAEGEKLLDTFSNFAKAFRVSHFEDLLGHTKANSARLKTSAEFKGNLMTNNTEFGKSPLRALLYALWEIQKEMDIEHVLSHLMDNCPNYLEALPRLKSMAGFLAKMREGLKPEKLYALEASSARILREALENQRI
jgi:putative DNA methylase